MTAYVMAQIRIHDRQRYAQYVAGFSPILARFGGRLLAAQEGPEILEGEWPHGKVILLAFDDQEAARLWLNSPEYQAISKDRWASTDGVALLVQGVS